MFKNILTIATRKSPLALWQAKYVKNALMNYYPNLNIKLMPMTTLGDVKIHYFSRKNPIKNLFVTELQQAVMTYKADIAVHSMKDVPIKLPQQLNIVAICKRANPFDAFVSNQYSSLNNLPYAAIIGTSSMRRKCQLINYRSDLQIYPIRGNIATRLLKLDSNEYDAIILAVAGLERLGLKHRIQSIFSLDKFIPAPGQGAIGIECLVENVHITNLVSVLNDTDTANCITAERAMNMYLNGGCSTPIGSYAVLENEHTLWLRGFIGSLDGKKIIIGECKGSRMKPEKIGRNLAKILLKKGALNILKNFTHTS